MRVDGHYIRVGMADSAEIRVTLIGHERYRVKGVALWGTDRASPHTGDIDFEGEMIEGAITRVGLNNLPDHRISLKFTADRLEVEEENEGGAYGMNVTFAGRYRKAGPVMSSWGAVRLALTRLLRGA